MNFIERLGSFGCDGFSAVRASVGVFAERFDIGDCRPHLALQPGRNESNVPERFIGGTMPTAIRMPVVVDCRKLQMQHIVAHICAAPPPPPRAQRHVWHTFVHAHARKHVQMMYAAIRKHWHSSAEWNQSNKYCQLSDWKSFTSEITKCIVNPTNRITVALSTIVTHHRCASRVRSFCHPPSIAHISTRGSRSLARCIWHSCLVCTSRRRRRRRRQTHAMCTYLCGTARRK